MRKNEIAAIEITGYTAEGNGVGRLDGMAVFVPGAAVGDTLQVRIVKILKNYAFGKIEELVVPSKDRIIPDCPCFSQCGGCSFRHISYKAELEAKRRRVEDAIQRIGGFDRFPVPPVVGAAKINRYRNKAQLPIGADRDGRGIMGFYALHSHRIVPIEDCPLQPKVFAQAVASVKQWMEEYKVPVYHEESHSGLLRHLYLREASATGALMVCLVGNGDELPHSGELVKRLREDLPCLESVVFNSNREKTNVILGKRCQALWGKDGIVDHLCGLSFFLSPLSFYQVNRDQAEILYRLAGEYASLQKEDTVLDLYCGTGTIGMTMASKAGKVIGVEVVPEAIEDAKANAVRNDVKNIEFICGDSAQAVQMLRKRGERPTVVVVDPPRKGCGLPVLEHIVEIAPRKIIYVSCDPATLARDLKLLVKAGYCLQTLAPVDLFPRTAHVETVALLEKADINLKN